MFDIPSKTFNVNGWLARATRSHSVFWSAHMFTDPFRMACTKKLPLWVKEIGSMSWAHGMVHELRHPMAGSSGPSSCCSDYKLGPQAGSALWALGFGVHGDLLA